MIQVLGLCRFSYPTGGGTGFAKAVDLYDPARLARRLRLFQAITLPPLRGQTDPDFTLLLLVGEHLPGPTRDALRALVAMLPQARLCVEPEGQAHMEVCGRLLRAHRNPRATRVAECRFDDDDAVATDFVARLRHNATRAAALVAGDRPIEVDFHNGLALRLGPDPRLIAVNAPHWTPAQGFLMAPGDRRTAFDFNHATFWKRDLCLSCPDPVMFIRTFHDDNDSSVAWAGVERMAMAAPPTDLPAQVKARFGLDAAVLRAL
jgi:hypothetical protein